MTKRLISFRKLDNLEGLIEKPDRPQERLEVLEDEAAQSDNLVQDAPELSQVASRLKLEIVASLKVILTRLKA